MRIKKLKIVNNVVLGNIDISFMDDNMHIKDMIILAGENGSGKTTLLEIVYNFISGEGIHKETCNEINEFTVEFTNDEIKYLKQNPKFSYLFIELIYKNEVVFTIDYSQQNAVASTMTYKNLEGKLIISGKSNWMFDYEMRNILRGVYSTAEINFISNRITSVTSKDLDEDDNSLRQSANLATEISQLLVDIKALDDSDLADWVNRNPGSVPPENIKEVRIKRFKKAFDYIFDGKSFKGITNNSGAKEILFEENGLEVPINKLSSGEKQIVFRGGFLLKNARRTRGAIIIIDEPELSLHPNWQMKIAEFFRRIFEDEEGKQTSQIIISTHSPFIIHNKYRRNDKVIVLKKEKIGQVNQVDNPKFYSCGSEETIKEAFDIDMFIEAAEKKRGKTLIITEGCTDWKHLKRAFNMLKTDSTYYEKYKDIEFEFLEFEDRNSNYGRIKQDMGDDRLVNMCEYYSRIQQDRKIIFIGDRDTDKSKKLSKEGNFYKDWGCNVYSFQIPVPEHRRSTPDICIEHYYLDEEIKTYELFDDQIKRRLFMGNDFNTKGIYINGDIMLMCEKTKICGEDKINIIEGSSGEKVLDIKSDIDINYAMPKTRFANNILNEKEVFNKVGYTSFEPIFNIIKEIIET